MNPLRRPSFFCRILLVAMAAGAGTLLAGAQENAPITSGLVDIGGYSLYIDCQGEGTPTVVLDSGSGLSGRSWLLVQHRIAQYTRVCSYDRAGIGGSDPGPTAPRSSQIMADELHTLLQNAHLPGPYVLVGHSLGGYNVRLFANAYPDDVAGMVFVDIPHEDLNTRYGEVSPRWAEEFEASWGDSEGITLEMWYATQQALRDARAAGPDPLYGAMPLVVLTATQEGPPLENPSLAETEAFRRVWNDLQADLAGLSSNSQHWFAEESGHFVQNDQPELVDEAVRWVVEQVRGQPEAPPDEQGTWEQGATMIMPRSEMPAAVLDGKIYIVGGLVDALAYGTQVTNRMEVYDLAADTWTELAAMPAGRHHHTLAAFEGRLYSFGAEGDTATYIYDPAADTWSEGAEMPSSRYGAAAVVLDEYIYVVGGVDRRVPPLLRYNPAADAWTELAPPGTVRDHVAAAVLDGKIWAIGGRDLFTADFSSTEIYDPATDAWTSGPALTTPRAGFSAAVLDGRIYVIGGEVLAGDAPAVVDTMERFDPAGGAWSVVTTLPRALHGVPMVAYDGALVVLGGSALAAGIENYGEVWIFRP